MKRNPAAPKVTLELDGQKYTLIMDMNAMAEFEEEAGKPIHAIGENMSMKDLRALIWACLLHSNPDMTPQDVGRLIHVKNLFAVGETIGNLYKDSMPEDEDVPDVEEKDTKTKN